jgi:hypothetical protein
MKLAHLVSIALLASCQVVPHSFQVMNASKVPIPPVNEDLTIAVGDKDYYSVSAILSSAVELSGIDVAFDGDVRSLLRHSVIELREDFTIPADEVWTVTEHILLQKGIYLSALYLGETKMIVVHNSDYNQGDFEGAELLELDVGDLDYLAVHPAFLFSLTLELTDTDVRLYPTRDICNRSYHDVQLRWTKVGKNTVVLEGLGFAVEKVARKLLETDKSNRLRKLTEAMQTADSKRATTD